MSVMIPVGGAGGAGCCSSRSSNSRCSTDRAHVRPGRARRRSPLRRRPAASIDVTDHIPPSNVRRRRCGAGQRHRRGGGDQVGRGSDRRRDVAASGARRPTDTGTSGWSPRRKIRRRRRPRTPPRRLVSTEPRAGDVIGRRRCDRRGPPRIPLRCRVGAPTFQDSAADRRPWATPTRNYPMPNTPPPPRNHRQPMGPAVTAGEPSTSTSQDRWSWCMDDLRGGERSTSNPPNPFSTSRTPGAPGSRRDVRRNAGT